MANHLFRFLKHPLLVIIIGGCAAVSVLTGVAYYHLRAYRVLTERERVAVVTCRETAKTRQPVLDVALFPDGPDTRTLVLYCPADEWVFDGRIIQWKVWFGLMGVKRYYTVDRISGRYRRVDDERIKPRVIYALRHEPDHFWEKVYALQRFLPFVEAVYGSSAFVPFEKGAVFDVLITHSGFMIKKVSPPRRRPWWFVG